LLSKSGLDQDLQLGMGTNTISTTKLPCSFMSTLPNEFSSSVFNASWIKYKGQLYKKGMLMVIDYNLCDCTFGKVMYMFYSKSKIPYFVLNRLFTIGFDSHYYAYEITKNDMQFYHIFSYKKKIAQNEVHPWTCEFLQANVERSVQFF